MYTYEAVQHTYVEIRPKLIVWLFIRVNILNTVDLSAEDIVTNDAEGLRQWVHHHHDEVEREGFALRHIARHTDGTSNEVSKTVCRL